MIADKEITVSLVFPDGTTIGGTDATDVLARLGRIQWTPVDVIATKEHLSNRAWAWSHFALDPQLADDEFLTALDASQMVQVVWGALPAKPRHGLPKRTP